MEEALSEPSVGVVPRFELGNVPISKTKRVARSPDITRKSIVSPKEISQFRYFFANKHENVHTMLRPKAFNSGDLKTLFI